MTSRIDKRIANTNAQARSQSTLLLKSNSQMICETNRHQPAGARNIAHDWATFPLDKTGIGAALCGVRTRWFIYLLSVKTSRNVKRVPRASAWQTTARVFARPDSRGRRDRRSTGRPRHPTATNSNPPNPQMGLRACDACARRRRRRSFLLRKRRAVAARFFAVASARRQRRSANRSRNFQSKGTLAKGYFCEMKVSIRLSLLILSNDADLRCLRLPRWLRVDGSEGDIERK